MKKLYHLLSIIRPLNIAFAMISSFVVFKFYLYGSPSTFFQLCIILASYMSAANILNDYIDVETDKINKPMRPLVLYSIDNRLNFTIIIILFCIGTIIAHMQNDIAKIIAIYIAMPLIIAYEIKLKKIPLIGNVIISLLVGIVFVFIEAGLSNHINQGWRIMILAFFLNLIREIIMDIEDI